ncbi:hypothetical protein D3C81_1816140 [compost metagenome]
MLSTFTRIDANQRPEIGEAQLARFHVTFQFRARFASGVGERAVNVAVTDAAIKIAVIKDRRFFRIDFGDQPPVRLKRWCIREQDAG